MATWLLTLFVLLPSGAYEVTVLERFPSFQQCEEMRLYVVAEMGKEYPNDTTSYLKCLPTKEVRDGSAHAAHPG